MPFVIFSIDKENNPLFLSAFASYIANCDLDGDNCLPVIGCYKGQTEHAFIINAKHFEAHVKPSGFVDGQESFLYVASGNKAEALLVFQDGRESVDIGCMKQVEESVAKACDAWTYRPDLGVYWVAMEGNNDRIVHGED